MKTLNLQNLIQLALEVEKKGAEIYNQLAEKYASNQQLAETFRLLAKDEQIHYNQFLALKNELPATLDVADEIDSEIFACVDPAKKISFFEYSQEELLNVLKIAYDFEKETYMFYNAVRDVIGSNETLNKIIQYEKSHMVKLMDYILTESKFRGISDKF